jgi:hypothetical protein
LLIQPLLYWQGLFGDFVFDDRFLIVETMGQLSFEGIWLSGLWEEQVEQANFYRPLFSTTIWLDQQVFGLNAVGYHFHSLIWHCINIALFARLATVLLEDAPARIATLIFSAHPLLSEVVFWISARNDTMAMTFVLAFLCVFYSRLTIQDEQAKQDPFDAKGNVLLMLCFFCGMLSKESVLILFLPVLWHGWRFAHGRALLAMMSIVTGLLFWWRNQIGIDAPEMNLDSVRNVLSGALPMMIDGFGRLFFPWRLSPATPIAWLSTVWWQLGLALCTIGILIKGAWTHQNRMWVCWILVGVLLSTPAIVYTGNIGDRYWAMSLIGWSILIAQVIPSRWIWIPIPFWMVAIFLRGAAWTSDMDFWSQEYALNPTPYSAVSLALIHYNEEDFASAMHGFYEGFSGEPPHLDGCPEFVSSVLSVEGAESALQASQWSIERGCQKDGLMLGLQSVILVELKQWDEVEYIANQPIDDPSRRLDVVRTLLDWRQGNETSFCQKVGTWTDKARLFRQLKILSKPDFQTMQKASCVSLNQE